MSAPEPKWTSPGSHVPRGLRKKWRTAHSATLVGHKIVILGGLGREEEDHKEPTKHVYILDVAKRRWSMLPIPQGLDGRAVFSLFAHTGTLVGDMIYYIGGFIGMEGMRCSEHVFCLDLVEFDFRVLETFSDFIRGPVADHAALYLEDRAEIVVLCGFRQFNDGVATFTKYPLLALKPETKVWRPMLWKGKVRLRRANHAVCLVARKLYVFGGYSHKNVALSDMLIIDFAFDIPQVTELRLNSGPKQRLGAVLFHHHGYLFLFGGSTDGVKVRLDDLFRFDLAQQSWNRCDKWTSEDSPSPRTNHKAVNPGGKVLVFGGFKEQLTRFLQIEFD